MKPYVKVCLKMKYARKTPIAIRVYIVILMRGRFLESVTCKEILVR